MTRDEQKAKARWEYVSERLCNSDYPIYNEERELESAFNAGAAWADAHPDWEAIVKRLQEEITNDLRQDRWISVDDELPPQYGTYLIATEGNVVEISLYDIDGWDNWRGGKVTHWMPTPQPPKKED